MESEDGGGEERWRWRQTRRCGSYGDGMVVMAVEPSCEGRRGPAHGTIKVSGRRSACSVLSTSFHTRWFEPFFGEAGVSKIRMPTCDRRTPVRADVFQHASMLAGARRPLAARTSAACRKSSEASPIAPPRLPTGRRSRRSIDSTLQRCQLLLRHRRERLHRRESISRRRERDLRPRERDLGRRERDLDEGKGSYSGIRNPTFAV